MVKFLSCLDNQNFWVKSDLFGHLGALEQTERKIEKSLL